jgi:hypothetical protein
MSAIPVHAHPAVKQSLTLWHNMIARNDLSALGDIVHPDAEFRSPMSVHKYAPAAALLLALRTVITVLEDFTYHRQLASDDGLDIMLEFSARVGDKRLKGIDLIRFDTDGLIREFEVMVRPLNALSALGAAMAARLGQTLPHFKQRNG